MPPELRLQFDRLQPNPGDPELPLDAPVPVTVHLTLDGNNAGDTERFNFINPLDDKVLGELRWYIEHYPTWPVGPDYARAEQLEATLPRWGHQLFAAIFQQSAPAMRLFERFDARRDQGGLLTIDTTEPRILRLPWELLADEGGYLFAKNPPVSIRRRLHRTRHLPLDPFTLPVRILLVVSRPDGAGFIDPRSAAAPLLDAVDELGGQVVVEFLRPPTLTSLTRRLRDAHQPRVHVVHFDGHGVYDAHVGLGFLLFEDDKYQPDLVDAERLGSLLNECRIPLVLLDACQSATPDEHNPFGSVAARLIEAGMGGVVAMNYSVLVATSKRLVGHFYAALAAGQPVGAALDRARFELLADTKRFTLYRPDQGEEVIRLQDWFVPALYQQEGEIRLFGPGGGGIVVSGTGDGGTEGSRAVGSGTEGSGAVDSGAVDSGAGDSSLGQSQSHAAFPPPPHHGFHGRARELLDLERAFATQPIVLLHGFGGQGKTSLATYAAEWLKRTGRFARTAFVSFEAGGGLELTLSELGNALVSDNFAIHSGDPLAAIGAALRATATLVVWDNFESILPNSDVALPPAALQELLNAAATWFAPTIRNRKSPISNLKSALLITTRDPILPHAVFAPGRTCRHYTLAGLHPSDALDLAKEILDAHALPLPPRPQLEQLLSFLGGHPLSLQLVLPQLRQTPAVATLLDEFETLLPGFKQGAGQERNQSLAVSLTFSLRRLGAEVQAVLPRLAFFEGRAFEDDLLAITEIDPSLWQRIRPELANAALITVEQLPGANFPFLRFHPTLAPFLAPQLPAAERSALAARYWQRYYAVADYLYQQDSKSPHFARTLAQRDLPNLRRGLTLALQAGALDAAVDFATSINCFLDYFGRWRERDALNQQVAQAVAAEQQTTNDDRLTKREFTLLSQGGELLLQQGRAGEAERVFRALLARLEAGAAYETGYDIANTLGRIGRTLKAQGHPSEAAKYHRQAIDKWRSLTQTDPIRRAEGVEYTELADVLRDQGQYAAAQVEYEASLAITKAIGGDDRGEAAVLGQLGTLALVQNKLGEARRRYSEALITFRSLGETQMEAIAWHQLGMVAEKAREWDEAERCYKESLALKERLGDLAGAAQTCNQLANVAEQTDRLIEAEQWGRRSLELKEKLGNVFGIGIGHHKLAVTLLLQNRLDEASDHIEKARQIYESLQATENLIKTYATLAQIAERRGDGAAARAWRRKEQATFASFPGHQHYVEQWRKYIAVVVAACQGGTEAISSAAQIVAYFSQSKDWHKLAAVMQRILEGERGDTIYEELDGLEALIVRQILTELAV